MTTFDGITLPAQPVTFAGFSGTTYRALAYDSTAQTVFLGDFTAKSGQTFSDIKVTMTRVPRGYSDYPDAWWDRLESWCRNATPGDQLNAHEILFVRERP